jgi:alkylated DNA nucleotide flippase Atl1
MGAEESGAADSFIERVLEVVAAIPPGRVMTYGGVAATLGSRASRAVGQIMAYYGSEVSWWRVVRAGGLAPRGHEQAALEQYRVEETPLRWGTEHFRVDLAVAEWSPGREDTE